MPNGSPSQSTPAVHGGESHVLALDGVRGVAVLTVICFHYLGGASQPQFLLHWFGNFLKFGYEGVTLFFILSGFLITGILWDTRGQPGMLRSFYIRRGLRIFPLYYCSILLCGVVGLALHAHGFGRALWAVAFFCQNLGYNGGVIDTMPLPLSLNHFWSLGVEEHFYLLWPFVLLAVRSNRAARSVCVAVVLLEVVVIAVYMLRWPGIFAYDYTLFAHAGSLAVGAWLALAQREIWPRVVRALPWVAALSLACFLGLALRPPKLELNGPWHQIAGHLAITFFLASVVAASLQPGWLARGMSTSGLRFAGKISYGLYVFHLLFIPVISNVTGHFIPHVGPVFYVARFCFAALLLPLLAWLSYTFLETPFLRLKNKFAPRRSEPSTTPGTTQLAPESA